MQSGNSYLFVVIVNLKMQGVYIDAEADEKKQPGAEFIAT